MKVKLIFLLLLCALLFFGCTQGGNDMNKDNNLGLDANSQGGYNNLNQFKKVKVGDQVAVNYTGKLTNGEVFDSSLGPGRTPLEFTVGAGQMIKGFDDGVVGMKVGDKKTVTIAPEDAYGVIDESKKALIPRADLPSDINVGQVLVIQPYRIKIYEINDANVLASINHFLAGETLIFEIEIVSIN